MKKQYEVALMKRVPNSTVDDLESINFIEANSYRDAVRIAKEQSLKWDGCGVICYVNVLDEDGEMLYRDEIFNEIYINGNKYNRIEY